MSSETYNDLFHTAMNLYHEHHYREALDLLTAEHDRFPDHAAMIAYLQACMANRAEIPEHAIQVLSESFDRGHWYGVELMRQSPALFSLQGDPEFERLAELGIQRQIDAVTDPKMFVLAPDGDGPHPMVFALHGNGDNGLHSLYAWNQLLDRDWLIAAPQSAKAESSEGFVWNDQIAALRQLVQQFQEIQAEYPLDQTRILVAGFSLGAETALQFALTSPLPITGFLLIAPNGPKFNDSDEWVKHIQEAHGKGLRGYVVVGTNDRAIDHGNIRRTVELLNHYGVPTELEIMPNLGHDYPSTMLPWFDRAIAFMGRK